MNQRFKELRKVIGLTQEEFAERINLSRSYINLIEMGKKIPAERTIKDICRTFKVNYTWLVHGSGEMFEDDDGDAQAIINAALNGQCQFARDTLVKLAKMDIKYWEMLADIIEQLKKE